MTEPIYDADCGCCMKPETREKYEASLPTPETQRVESVEETTHKILAHMELALINKLDGGDIGDIWETLKPTIDHILHHQLQKDHQHILAVLKEGVKEIKEFMAVASSPEFEMGYQMAIKDYEKRVLTIINSIFKE